MLRLSAIVPATDHPPTLDHCLAAIKAATEPPEELIVVAEPADVGPAAARNEGVRQATGDVVVFVDADVAVHSDAFATIRRAFERDVGLAAVFGSYDDDPGGASFVSDFRNLLHHHVHQQGSGPAETFWAGLGAVRRKDFVASGCFDERRFPKSSIEDVEFGMRLARRGERVILDPALQGKHFKRWTLASMVETDLFRRGIPWVKLLLETRSASTSLNLGWRHRISAAASVAVIGMVVTNRAELTPVPLFLLIALNSSFYRLIRAKRGWASAVGAIPLHFLHHLTTAVSVPLGVAAYLLDERRPRASCSAV